MEILKQKEDYKMSNKKNYTNYNNKFQGSRAEVKPVDEAVVEPVMEEEVETVEEAVQEEVVVEETIEEPTTSVGIVECKNKLNVRKLPKKDAMVLCEIPNGSSVQVDLEKSTLEWYNVITPAGIEGFCMKNFVAVK